MLAQAGIMIVDVAKLASYAKMDLEVRKDPDSGVRGPSEVMTP